MIEGKACGHAKFRPPIATISATGSNFDATGSNTIVAPWHAVSHDPCLALSCRLRLTCAERASETTCSDGVSSRVQPGASNLHGKCDNNLAADFPSAEVTPAEQVGKDGGTRSRVLAKAQRRRAREQAQSRGAARHSVTRHTPRAAGRSSERKHVGSGLSAE
jgi:hypothetical protein